MKRGIAESRASGRRNVGLLRDRNLIVHHGATFTTRYHLEQSKADPARIVGDAYWNSLIVDKKQVTDEIDLILHIAKKIVRASSGALESHLATSVLDPERQKALEYMGSWDV